MNDLRAVKTDDDEFEIVVQQVQQAGVTIDQEGRSIMMGLYQNFQGLFEDLARYEEQAKSIEITDISQIAEMEMAKKLRLEIRTIRTTAEKEKDRLKANILRQGNLIDGINRVIRSASELLESALKEKEDFALRKEQARKAEIRRVRAEALTVYGVDTANMTLEDWTPAFFETFLESSKLAAEKKREEAARAEQERIAREQEAAAEQERIKADNERLKKEAEERELAAAKERKKLEKARVDAEKKATEERAAHEAEMLEAKEKADAEMKAIEEKAAAERAESDRKAAIDRAEIAKKAAKEREAREKAEAEAKILREKAAAEAREREDAEAKAAAEAKKAAGAPDKVKLQTLAKIFEAINLPEVSTPEAQAIIDKVKIRVSIMATDIRAGASNI